MLQSIVQFQVKSYWKNCRVTFEACKMQRNVAL